MSDFYSRRRNPPAGVPEDVSDLIDDVPVPRGDVRPAMRPPATESPQARAARRAEELREHIGENVNASDRFYIDTSIIPPGWDYQFKRRTVLGAEDPAYQVELRRAGWEPVPTSRHPEMMPLDGHYPIIERDGMVLMERPKVISDEARARESRDAREQVQQKEIQLGAAAPGEFERANKGESMVKVKRTYETIPVPQE